MVELDRSNPAVTRLATRWVTEKQFAEFYGLHPATLCNWRYRDRKAGRTEAPPGFPKYRYFGGAVRYWLDTEASDGGRAA